MIGEKEFIGILYDAIRYELEDYSNNLYCELYEKYQREFADKLRARTRGLVLDVADKILIENNFDENKRVMNVTIKL